MFKATVWAGLLGISAGWKYPPCATGMTACIKIRPYPDKDLEFDCAVVNTSMPHKGNVYAMHGDDGKYSKAMFAELMVQLAEQGYNSLACDQRGFSPGASPNNASAYNYDLLAEELYAITDAYFGVGAKHHHVAHDQGARISWHAIAKGPGRQRFLTFSSLSIPHADAFSDALYGPSPDPKQQTASQYMREFMLPDAVHVYNGAIYNKVCGTLGWTTPETCAPSFWWYNGAVDSGNLAVPPVMPFGAIGKMIGIPEDFVTNNTQFPLSGVPQRTKVGNVTEFPVLFLCGVEEVADLCTDRMHEETAKRVADLTYVRLQACGHNVLSCSDKQKTIDAVIANVQAA
jgi:pimeloyl-ACP methyl ester carboxylesterase